MVDGISAKKFKLLDSLAGKVAELVTEIDGEDTPRELRLTEISATYLGGIFALLVTLNKEAILANEELIKLNDNISPTTKGYIN